MQSRKTDTSTRPIVIIGAGITGLTAGYALAAAGRRVIIIEKERRVGGLARSFTYGRYTFDIGPHRFHSTQPRILSSINDVLGPSATTILRHSGVHFCGRYYTWPLQPAAVFRLPPSITLRSALDLARLFVRRPPRTGSFEEYILKHYGPSLYNAFFRDYTEKFLGIAPDRTHAEWARLGMQRAVINEDDLSHSLFSILRSFVRFSGPAPLRFIYPEGGTGRYAELLAERIRQRGGEIVTGDSVLQLRHDGARITGVFTGGTTVFDPERVIWTAPLDELCRLLQAPDGGLEYLDLVLYNIEAERLNHGGYQWCYFGGKDTVFSRVSVPRLFHQGLAPEGKASLCVEVPCRRGAELWKDPESLVPRIRQDLLRTGLIAAEADLGAVHVERIPAAYPCYTLDYPGRLARAQEALSAFGNLACAGRCGRFWYNNMDDSIGDGLTVADGILAGAQA